VDDAEPLGPFGAKGVGEPALIPTAPAILNAIHHAAGVRITHLPATPDRVRKAILEQIVKDVDDAIRFSDHMESDGEIIFRKACELHAEGIVSKRANSVYHSGRGGDWLLSLVHMEASKEEGADWRSYWASLSFSPRFS
jgi:hypothetical protein